MYATCMHTSLHFQQSTQMQAASTGLLAVAKSADSRDVTLTPLMHTLLFSSHAEHAELGARCNYYAAS